MSELGARWRLAAHALAKGYIVGDVSIERTKSSQPRSLVCIVGDKGKVLATYFSTQ